MRRTTYRGDAIVPSRATGIDITDDAELLFGGIYALLYLRRRYHNRTAPAAIRANPPEMNAISRARLAGW